MKTYFAKYFACKLQKQWTKKNHKSLKISLIAKISMTSYENALCDLNINSFYNIDLYELFPLPYGPLSKSSGIISSDNKLVGSLLKVAVLEFPP